MKHFLMTLGDSLSEAMKSVPSNALHRVLSAAMFAGGLCLPVFGHCVVAGETAKFGQTVLVESGSHPRRNVPVSIDFSPAAGTGTASPNRVRLIETTDGAETPVPSQIESGNPLRLWWIMKGETPARAKRTFRIEQGDVVPGTGITVDRQPEFLVMRYGDAKVLRYNSAHVDPPAGISPKHGRSAHLHPVWTPGGAVVTEQFPTDHPHQSGIFLAFVNTEFENRTPDFWNLGGGTGRVRFKSIRDTISGPVFGQLELTQEHVDLSAPEPKVALNESWQIRVWNPGEASPKFWICDITSRLTCATDSPLRLPHYHYGGMALRGAAGLGSGGGRFLTSEGKDRLEGNHTRPRWCDVSGPVGEQTAGLAILTQAQNFRFPEPLRIHPTMPYMVYTPSHVADWEIVPGQTHVSRYRFLIHDGELPRATINQLWNQFSTPLVAKCE